MHQGRDLSLEGDIKALRQRYKPQTLKLGSEPQELDFSLKAVILAFKKELKP